MINHETHEIHERWRESLPASLYARRRPATLRVPALRRGALQQTSLWETRFPHEACLVLAGQLDNVFNSSFSVILKKRGLFYDVTKPFFNVGCFGLVGFKKARICVYTPKNDSGAAVEKEFDQMEEESDLKSFEPVVEEPASEIFPDIVERTDDADDDGLEDIAKETLQYILDAITDGTEINVHRNRTEMRFDVSGGDSGILIGKKGQTLEAMQYLLEKMVRDTNPKRLRIKVDVEGYLKSREDNLIKQSKNLAQKVKKTGKPVVVGQMNPNDRRIVHVALKGHPGVRTQSKGDGFIRKILILPKKNSRKKPNAQNANHRFSKG